MTVSLCVIAYNEEGLIRGLLDDISKQTYPHNLTELVFVNNGSTDTTADLFSSFANINSDFLRICIRSQEKLNQAHGWNTAISNAMGDIIIRIDAHARIPHNYIEECVKEIEKGENIVGGSRPCITQQKTDWDNTLLSAEECLFGSSFMSYRRKHEKKEYLSSLFHAAYRREVFAKVGGFNENLGRTEDNELHYRMRKAGYKFACCPSIKSNQYIRGSLPGMVKQKFSNGFWIGLTLFICPGCLSIAHFAPFGLVIGLIVTAVLMAMGTPELFWALLLAYVIFDIAVTASALKFNGYNKKKLLLFFIFPILHISYGLGTILGILDVIPWRISHPMKKAKAAIRRVKHDVRNNTIE